MNKRKALWNICNKRTEIEVIKKKEIKRLKQISNNECFEREKCGKRKQNVYQLK